MNCTDLLNTFDYHRRTEPTTLNEYILEIRPIDKLKSNIEGICNYCYHVLTEIVRRYKIAEPEETKFIEFDVKRLALNLFKPYFNVDYWINEERRKYEKLSHEYKLKHDINDFEPPDDIYNSIVIYLNDFVINLSM